MSMPIRLAVARLMVQYLPPFAARPVRKLMYPQQAGKHDNYDFRVRAQTGSVVTGNTTEMHARWFSTCGYGNYRNWALALAFCKPGDTIVEVGAHIGTETIGFADIVGCEGRVIAFEPLPDNITALKTSLALKSCSNITVFAVALGEAAATAKFAVPKVGNTGVGKIMRDTAPDRSVIEVEVKTLDSYADEIGVTPFICMDAEDSERFILKGGENYIRQHHPTIVVEAHRQVQADLYAEIERLGYQALRITPLGLQAADLRGKSHADWLCIHPSKLSLIPRANQVLRQSSLLPCLPGLNPITRH